MNAMEQTTRTMDADRHTSVCEIDDESSLEASVGVLPSYQTYFCFVFVFKKLGFTTVRPNPKFWFPIVVRLVSAPAQDPDNGNSV